MNNNKKVRYLVIAAVIIVPLLLAITATLLILKPEQKVSIKARQKALDLLQDATKKQQLAVITSDFGFSIKYDNSQIDGEGLVQNRDSRPGYFEGNSYSGAELNEVRSYGIVRLTFKERGGKVVEGTEKLPRPQYTPIRPDFSIVANRNKDYFANKDKLPEYADKSELDILSSEKRKSILKSSPNDEISEKTVRINKLEYRLLTVKHRSKVLDKFATHGTSFYYLTVQNNRPYWLSINNVKDGSKGDSAVWESVIASVEYAEPNQDSLVFRRPAAQLAAKTPDDTANIRDHISSNSMIKVVAKNQLATVRVGSIRCGTIDYRLNSARLILKNTCTWAIGSGSIISSDGLVATNGHVTTITDGDFVRRAWPRSNDDWNNYYDFVEKAGLATRATIIDLWNKSKNGDREASQKLTSYLNLVPMENIRISDNQRKFVIQTSDDPIKLNDATTDWKYSETNKSASLIDEEVDPIDSSFSKESSYADVALLRMDGDFPTVKLSNMTGVRSGDEVTAIGYPAVVDGGTETKKIRTVPSVTQGSVVGVSRVGGGRLIMLTTAQIASGNSGGPAFDASGLQIGINTYGGSKCPEDSTGNQCFGRGVARDAEDINEMARKNNVRILADGSLSSLWQRGLDEFLAGQYSLAAKTFEELDQKYSGNYLIKKFYETAKEQPADENLASDDGYLDSGYDDKFYSSTDLTKDDQIRLVLVIAAVVLGSVFMVIIVVIVVLLVIYGQKKTAPRPAIAIPQMPQNQFQQPQQRQFTQSPSVVDTEQSSLSHQPPDNDIADQQNNSTGG